MTYVRAYIEKAGTQLLQWKSTLTLWFMATNADYRTTRHPFVTFVVRCAGLWWKHYCTYVYYVSGSGLASVISGFCREGFPQWPGIVDGTPPTWCTTKPSRLPHPGWSTVALQVLVDHIGCWVARSPQSSSQCRTVLQRWIWQPIPSCECCDAQN